MIIGKEINNKFYIYNSRNRRIYCFNKRVAELFSLFFKNKNAKLKNFSKKAREYYYGYFKKDQLL